MGASIKPHIIDEEIKRQVRELYNGNEAKFREELKKGRLTMDRYREMTQEKMVVQAMRAQKFSDAPPPLPNEINKEYAEIKDSMRDTSKDLISFQKIFIPRVDAENPASTPDIQLTLAENLAKQIQDGKDFTELAKANSKDAFAEQGGVQVDVPRIDLCLRGTGGSTHRSLGGSPGLHDREDHQQEPRPGSRTRKSPRYGGGARPPQEDLRPV
jgi:hypothetical protein